MLRAPDIRYLPGYTTKRKVLHVIRKCLTEDEGPMDTMKVPDDSDGLRANDTWRSSRDDSQANAHYVIVDKCASCYKGHPISPGLPHIYHSNVVCHNFVIIEIVLYQVQILQVGKNKVITIQVLLPNNGCCGPYFFTFSRVILYTWPCSAPYAYFVPYAYRTTRTHKGHPIRVRTVSCPVHVWASCTHIGPHMCMGQQNYFMKCLS